MRISVLIIEDNAKDCERVQKILEENFENFLQIYVATNSHEAFDLAEYVKIDILISDIHLQEDKYNGVDVTKKLLDEYPHMTVIFQSDIVDPQFRLDLHHEIEYLTYVTKIDVDYELKLKNKIGRAIDIILDFPKRNIVFSSSKNSFFVDERNLIAVRTTDHRNVLQVYYIDRRKEYATESIYGVSLKSVLDLLSVQRAKLIRVQQSWVINPLMVSHIDHTSEELYLFDGDFHIPIGREYKKCIRAMLKSLIQEDW